MVRKSIKLSLKSVVMEFDKEDDVVIENAQLMDNNR